MYIKCTDQITGIEIKEIISSDGVAKITLTDSNEVVNTSGFRIYSDKECTEMLGNYDTFTTEYRPPEDGVFYLSTGVVYVAGDKMPIEPEKTPDQTQEKISSLIKSMDFILLELMSTV